MSLIWLGGRRLGRVKACVTVKREDRGEIGEAGKVERAKIKRRVRAAETFEIGEEKEERSAEQVYKSE